MFINDYKYVPMCLKKLRKKTVGYITQNLIKGERFIQSEKKPEYDTLKKNKMDLKGWYKLPG